MCRLSVWIVDTIGSPGWGWPISEWLIYLQSPPTTAATNLFITSVILSLLKYQSVITTWHPPPINPTLLPPPPPPSFNICLPRGSKCHKFRRSPNSWHSFFFLHGISPRQLRGKFCIKASPPGESVFAFNFSDWHFIFKLFKYVTACGASMRVNWTANVSHRLRFSR